MVILPDSTSMSRSGINHEKLDQLLSAQKRMKAAQQKYIEKKTLFDAVVKVADIPSKLPPETAHRTNQVLQHISLLDYVTPSDGTNEHSSFGAFGISKKDLEAHFPNQLTTVDKKHLRTAVAAEISAKHQHLVQLNKRHTGTVSKLVQ